MESRGTPAVGNTSEPVRPRRYKDTWNPTGSVFRRDELQTIMDFAVNKNLFVISDEIYETLVYDGRKHVSPASLKEAWSTPSLTSIRPICGSSPGTFRGSRSDRRGMRR